MAAVAVSSPKSTIFQNPISLREEPSSSHFGGSLEGFLFPGKSKSRKAINLVVAATNSTISGSRGGGDRFYTNFTGFPFPLGPFVNRSSFWLVACHASIFMLTMSSRSSHCFRF
ncbi:hypothetical protein PS1_045623 [Malus domestica]